MSDTPTGPQLYLIAPTNAASSSLPDLLAPVLDAAPVACLRLPATLNDETELGRLADIARDLSHARDIAVVIDDHVLLAQRHGLDGVHLRHGARGIRTARKQLGSDAIIGAFCAASRHDGLNAGEAGADYVSFGPVGKTTLGMGEQAPLDLLKWWSDVVEVPMVAEGALNAGLIAQLGPISDFIAIGPEIWVTPEPAATLRKLLG